MKYIKLVLVALIEVIVAVYNAKKEDGECRE